jgi:3-oxoacyl-[acyl-carrier protein] reductase
MMAGPVAVVTGASSGIGRALALAFGQAGYRVGVGFCRSRGAAEAVCDLIPTALPLAADVSDPGAVARMVSSVTGAWGAIDVWVNNAGADILTGDAGRLPDFQRLEQLLRVDVMGTFACCRAVAPEMQARGGGLILNMAWDHVACGMAGPEGELFALAKGAVWAYSKSLARSLAPTVRVNTLAPGWVRTKFAETLSDASVARISAGTPLGRLGVPDDLAGVALFLASPAARFITGQTFAVNGGVVMF